MANKLLFRSVIGKLLPKTDAVNEESAPAYRFTPKQILAQYAATGCLNSTFYASETEQLDVVLKICESLEPDFIAQTAVYCREKESMKDMPALLCAVLSIKSPATLKKVFERVIDNGKMLRNFVQIIRSGVSGRKSLGSLPKRLVKNWLETRSDDAVFRASVGNDPSLGDIVKMVHPKAKTKSREALYGWLIGRDVNYEILPEMVKHFEEWKKSQKGEIPDVPFQMLTALNLGQTEWTAIAQNAGWQMTRMNLNTFARHNVFKDNSVVKLVAERLRDPKEIEKAKVYPYQLLVAYRMAGEDIPPVIREALQDALEIAIQNVPRIMGKVYVFPDVSGSMASPVTGRRKGATTAVRCIDVAALMAAAILRKNPEAEVIPFETDVVKIRLNPRDTVMTNADKLAKIGGGGTNCSAPLAKLNHKKAKGDLVIYVSDNESWVDAGCGRGTATMQQWCVFKKLNPKAQLVCIDIQPYATTQAQERNDILNVGGFSDQVFTIVSEFAAGRLNPDHWVGVIEQVKL
jgi:60 kDa SS-A/Ro ribonucleoprotein